MRAALVGQMQADDATAQGAAPAFPRTPRCQNRNPMGGAASVDDGRRGGGTRASRTTATPPVDPSRRFDPQRWPSALGAGSILTGSSRNWS